MAFIRLTIEPIAGISANVDDQSLNVKENTLSGTVIGYITGFPEGENVAGLTFTPRTVAGANGDDNGRYSIVYNATLARWEVILVKGESETTNFDFEFPEQGFINSIDYTISGNNPANFYEPHFDFYVEDVEEAPSQVELRKPDGTVGTIEISETTANTTVIGRLQAYDDEEMALKSHTGDLTFQIIDSAGNVVTNGPFAIERVPVGTEGEAEFRLKVVDNTKLSVEQNTTFQVRVRVSDPQGNATTKTFDVLVTAANEGQAPSDIALSAATIAENAAGGTQIGTLTGTDPNPGDTLTFSLLTDASGKFEVVGNKLQLKAGAALDHETNGTHQVTVRVTDQTNRTYDEMFTITVTNVNEKPTDITLSATAVAESATGGTAIATLGAADPDAGSTFTYAIQNDPDGKFQIVGNVLQVKAGATLDHETKTAHQVTVRVTDQGGLTHDEVVTITVTNDPSDDPVPNRAPTGLVLIGSSVLEYAGVGTSVGTAKAVDADGDTLTYSLSDSAGGRFAINASTGRITLAGAVNFEQAAAHTIKVVASDGRGGTTEQSFVITVGDQLTLNWRGTARNDRKNGSALDDILKGGARNGSDQLKGLSGDDQLYGEDGNDKLYGGEGLDRLYGGKGNDQLRGEGGDDQLFGDDGNDQLYGGVGNDKLSGGKGNDQLRGDAGDDRLEGGIGHDQLYGGAGRDVFVFNTQPNRATNVDQIKDFRAADDAVWLDNAIFRKLGAAGSETAPAALNKEFFVVGTRALERDDYLVFNSRTKTLYYDADGSGRGAAVEIAKFSTRAVTVDDFFVI